MIPTEAISSAVPGGARCAAHPDRPAEFTCTRCGNFACGPCKHLGADDALFCSACRDHAFGDIPLEQRAELGLPRAVLKTITGVLFAPWTFFAQRSREPSLLPPLLFGTLIHLPGTLTYAVLNAFTLDAQLEQFRNHPLFHDSPFLQNPLFESMFSPGGRFGFALVTLVLYPLLFVIYAGLEWVANFAVGARAPFREVFRAICYLQATALVLLPLAPLHLLAALFAPALVGFVMMPFWLFVLIWMVIAMWKTTRTEVWRPVVAQGLLLFTCCCLPLVLSTAAMIAFLGANLPR